jgi:hypothetical protein
MIDELQRSGPGEIMAFCHTHPDDGWAAERARSRGGKTAAPAGSIEV